MTPERWAKLRAKRRRELERQDAREARKVHKPRKPDTVPWTPEAVREFYRDWQRAMQRKQPPATRSRQRRQAALARWSRPGAKDRTRWAKPEDLQFSPDGDLLLPRLEAALRRADELVATTIPWSREYLRRHGLGPDLKPIKYPGSKVR